jgi:hypothetical protein
MDLVAAFCLSIQKSPINFAFLGGLKDDNKIKRDKSIGRHGPRPMPNFTPLVLITVYLYSVDFPEDFIINVLDIPVTLKLYFT